MAMVLDTMVKEWTEIKPSEELRRSSIQLLRHHALRAADETLYNWQQRIFGPLVDLKGMRLYVSTNGSEMRLYWRDSSFFPNRTPVPVSCRSGRVLTPEPGRGIPRRC